MPSGKRPCGTRVDILRPQRYHIYEESVSPVAFGVEYPAAMPGGEPAVARHPPAVNMNNEDVRILVVDDEESMRGLVEEVLLLEGYRVLAAGSVTDARNILSTGSVDAVVTDIRMPDGSGLDVIRHARSRQPSVPVVVITAYPGRDYVGTAEDLGVHSFITKPFTTQQLRYSVLGALQSISPSDRRRLSEGERGSERDTLGLIGVSSHIVALRRGIRSAARAVFPVLIQGASGTGKDLVARAIHRCSERNRSAMVTLNCAAIPEHLQEAELFGHCRGAFTGAITAREGIMAAADNSTLFLDEVAELSPPTQAKLLRVLETGEYVRLGETRPRTADIRVLSATNRDLGAMVESRTFREDLYYRLKGLVLETWPLSAHPEDIPALVRFFLAQHAAPGTVRTITAEALSILVRLPWPGNVRELRHAVELMVHRAAGQKRLNRHVVDETLGPFGSEASDEGGYLAAKGEAVHAFEYRYFSRLLTMYEGNISRAAERAQMDRSNLSKKVRSLGLRPEEFRNRKASDPPETC